MILKQIIRRKIARHFYPIVNLFYFVKFKFIKFNQPPIIILTPGKVGSSSVYYTLKKKLNRPVYHVHYLTPKSIVDAEKIHLNSDRKSRPLHLIVAKHLIKKLSQKKQKMHLITIVREPVGREISAFFQNTEFLKNTIERHDLSLNETAAREILYNKLKNNFIADLESWFQREFKEPYNIDIFSTCKFDKNREYNIFNNEQLRLLVLRMESLSHAFPKALKEFLNFKDEISLENYNIGDQKHYSKSYAKIKKNLQLNHDVLECILNSRYVSSFYADYKSEIIAKYSPKSSQN